ncbi:class I adenylate-forming enzyme family protein [Niveispirillum sp.]|uniref:class I adenylate-forming enzyme family protein n=1 Tax=Niveispirillum sp. TaxID=1917217 RepID=UPI001B3EC027|nr:AMP-binding protein [Niveispirillum sp.]MBP7337114.1 AMP-binding protein [Niveispirillum sp.]
MSFTVNSALGWWAREMPDQTALSVDGQPCTFRELQQWSLRVGEHLTDAGVRPGDRVCVIGTNSMNYAVLAFALAQIGAIGAPLSFRSTPSEIADALAELTPSLVFTDADRRANAATALGGEVADRLRALETLFDLRRGPDLTPRFDPDPDAPLFIIGTSGSTARPKGVIYIHRMVMTYAAEFAITEPRCGRGARVLSAGPFSSSSGYLLLMQFTAMGVTSFIESQFKADRALDLLVREKITTFQAAPIFFERIAALPGFAAADLSHLYWTQVGGARVSPALLKAWLDKGVVLRQAYGSTEAGGGWGACLDTAIVAPEKCGRGGMFTRYAVRGADGGFAPPGTPGEILISSPCVTIGYWNNPQATAEAIRDGWLHTGDIGVMDADGNLTFTDRLKDIIISGGLNISAAEVEKAIAEIDGVEEVAVIAATDPDFGETPLAIVHGDPDRISVAGIIDHCNARLTNYKVPRYVAVEASPLPRLPSGKIAKPQLRARYKDAAAHLPKVR